MQLLRAIFKKISVLAIVLTVLILPFYLKAQELSLGLEYAGSAGLASRDLRDIVVSGIQIVLGLIGLIMLGLIIYSGFLIMKSAGDEAKIKKGKQILTSAVIGLVIVFSAYAITTFILGRILDATGGEVGGSGGNGGGTITSSSNFQPNRIYPSGQLSIRNVVVSVRFNKAIKPESVTNNAVKIKKSNGVDSFVDVPINIVQSENNRLIIRPTTLCPDSKDVYCFDYDAENKTNNKHVVNIEFNSADAVIDVNGKKVSCSPEGRCQAEFIVGADIDTSGPQTKVSQLKNTLEPFEIKTTNPNANVSYGGAFVVEATAQDVSGVADVSFFEKMGNEFKFIGSDVASEFSEYFVAKSGPPGLWQTTDYQINKQYSLVAVASDYAGNISTSSESLITIKPRHCFNNELDGNNDPDIGVAPDEPETNVDCGGICGACNGDSCRSAGGGEQCLANNSACSSLACDTQSCLCTLNPVITEVSLDNGAPGNWITIIGKNFGSQVGSLTINGQTMSVLNQEGCSENKNWTEGYVIAVVPEISDGVKNISLKTKGGLISNNIEFTVNQTKRPGICSLDKPQYEIGQQFNITGQQFGLLADNRDVVLGKIDEGISAENPTYQATTVSGKVPNVQPGKMGVSVKVNNQYSNTLPIKVNRSAEDELKILSFSPLKGAPGQYVTITGNGFGSLKGESQVLFSDKFAGEFDFSKQCGTDFWSNNQIIVKVPNITGESDLSKVIKVKVGNQIAASVEKFTFDKNLKVSPGLCSINPKAGAVGSEFEVAGDNLKDSSLRFKDASQGVTILDNNGGKFNVPSGAVSGEVVAVNISDPSLSSNPLNFEVKKTVGSNNGGSAYYQWQFKTCADCYRPKVVANRQCVAGQIASPSPRDGSIDNFIDSTLSVTFDRVMSQDSLNGDKALLLEKCGSGETASSKCDVDNNIILSAVVNGSNTNGNSTVLINKSKNLSTNTWYKVTIAKTAKSVDGVSLEQPYSWIFKTRAENGNCSVDVLSCTPTAFSLPFSSTANVFAHAYNGATCNICPTVGGWNWEPVNSSVAVQAGVSNQAVVTALEQDDKSGVKASNSFYTKLEPGLCSIKVVAPAPKLIINDKCDVDIQSPSPFIDSTAICPNTMIAIRFNVAMKPELLEQSNAIKLQTEKGQTLSVSFVDFISDEQGQEIGALYKPSSQLNPNSKYAVSLNTELLQSKSGQLLDVNSVTNWWFSVGDSNNCKIKDIFVNPSKRSLVVGESEKYSAVAIGQSCQLISTIPTGWQWRSTDTSVATTENTNNSTANVATVNPGTTYVKARYSNIENKANNGLLIVTASSNDNSFKLIKVEPNGENICTNALVRATFNRPINPATIRISGKKDNIGLGKINNQIVEPVEINAIVDPNGLSVSFEVAGNFDPNTKYVAYVGGSDWGVTSFDGKKLSKNGCVGSGMTWNIDNESCEWNYTTADKLCEVKSIDLTPKNASLVVDDAQYWQASAYSADGSLLNNKSNWSVDDSSIINIVNQLPQPSYGVTTTAITAGSTKIKANIGSVEQLGGIEVKNKDIGPILSEVEPISPPLACLNSLISAKFDSSINVASLNNNANVVYQGVGCDNSSINILHLFNSQAQISKKMMMPTTEFNSFFYNVLAISSKYIGGNILKTISNFVAHKVLADDAWCSVEGTWKFANSENSEEVIFTQSKALPANSKVRVVFNGGENGLVGINGLPAKILTGSSVIKNFSADKFGWEFNTNNSLCKVAYVDVYADEVNNRKDWMFSRSDNDSTDDFPICTTGNCDKVSDSDKVFTAVAKTVEGKKIVPIQNVYSWFWSWRSSDLSVAGVGQVEKPAGTVLPDKQLVVAENKNGETTISATAVFPPTANQTAITGSSKATVFMCNNPWPTIAGQWQPITDNKYNFSFFYCRDNGAVGQQDDLPEIKFPGQNNPFVEPKKITNNNNQTLPICSISALEFCKGKSFVGVNKVVTAPTNGPCAVFTGNQSVWQYNNSGTIVSSLNCISNEIYNDYPVQNNGKNNLLRQYLLEIPETSGDAVALRVYGNIYQNNANDWYKFNVTNPGAPKTISTDSNKYPLIQESRSSYIAFANQDAPVSSPNVAKSFTLVASYNQDANKNTVSIADQIVKNIKFNTNIQNDDQKDKLVRDFKRVSDLQSIAKTIYDYFLSVGTMPTLTGGTFIPAMTLSNWPSWQQTFASLLKTTLPVDPTNEFGACSDCVNTDKYATSFENEDDLDLYQTINASSSRICNGQVSAPAGNCLAQVDISSSASGDGVNRIIRLSAKTTYKVTGKIFMTSTSPDVLIKLTNNSSITKDYLVSHSVKDEWKNFDFEITTNASEDYGLGFFSATDNKTQFYLDDIKLETVGGRCADFEMSTCWNPKANNGAGEFACSKNSFGYLYKYSKTESNPALRGKLYALTELVNNWINDNGGINTNLDSKITLLSSNSNLPVCTAGSVGVSCGDGVVNAPEICELGDSVQFCDAGKNWYSPAVNLCESNGVNACMSWKSPMTTSACSGFSTAAKCCGGYCGDGVLNTKPNYRIDVNEQCDVSVVNGDKGYGSGNSSANQYACSQTCHDVGGWCGDATLQTQYGEQCDGSIGISEWSCSDGSTPICNGCSVKCNGTAVAYRGLCGNNVIENGEQCDYCGNGLQSVPGQGECSGKSATAQYFCTGSSSSGQCKWTGGWCGNGVVDVVNGQKMEYCDWTKSGQIISTVPSTNNAVACENSCKKYQCKANFYDCDASAENGCETNGLNGMWVEKGTFNPVVAPNVNSPTQNDINNKELISCGGCVGGGGVICSWVANSAPMCSNGKCQLNCLSGYVDENNVYEDGCEKIGSSISGKVNNQNNTPIADATVMLLNDSPNDKSLVSTVKTSSAGDYNLIGLEKGKYKIIAYKKGFYSEKNNINITAGGVVNKNFSLAPGDQSIQGSIQKYVSGQAVSYPSQTVKLWYQPDAEQDYELFASVVSASNGSYSFSGLEKGGVFKVTVTATDPGYYDNETVVGALVTSINDQNIVMNKCGDGVVAVGKEFCDGGGSSRSCSQLMTPLFSSLADRNWDGNLVCKSSCQELEFSGLVREDNNPTYRIYSSPVQLGYKSDLNKAVGSDCSYGPPKNGKNYRMIWTEDIWNLSTGTTIDTLVDKTCYFRADNRYANNPDDDPWRKTNTEPGYTGSVFMLPNDSTTSWYEGTIVKSGSGSQAVFYCSSDSYNSGAHSNNNANTCSWRNSGRLWGTRMCWIEN